MSLLHVSGLCKSFGGLKAVDDVSFTLEAGQLLALLGPNGAGKSTCFNMVNGQLSPSSGSIRFDGHELVGMRPRDIWRLGVGRTFQIAATFNSMTVLENVQMALVSRERKPSACGSPRLRAMRMKHSRCSSRSAWPPTRTAHAAFSRMAT